MAAAGWLCRFAHLDLGGFLYGANCDPSLGRRLCRSDVAVQLCRKVLRVWVGDSFRFSRHCHCLAILVPQRRRVLLLYADGGGGLESVDEVSTAAWSNRADQAAPCCIDCPGGTLNSGVVEV